MLFVLSWCVCVLHIVYCLPVFGYRLGFVGRITFRVGCDLLFVVCVLIVIGCPLFCVHVLLSDVVCRLYCWPMFVLDCVFLCVYLVVCTCFLFR